MVLIRPCPRKAGIRYPCFFGGGGGGGGGLTAVVGLGDTPSFMLAALRWAVVSVPWP